MKHFNRIVAVKMCNWWISHYLQADDRELVLDRIAYWAQEAAKNA